MVTKSNRWSMRPIGNVGEVIGGRQRSYRITAGSPRPYLRVANVFDGYIDYSDVLEMPFTDGEFRKFALQPGDILFNEGQSLELVGRNARFDGPPNKFAFQNTLVRFRAGRQITIDYATQLFKYLFITGRFISIARKTTSIAHLGSSRLAMLEVPIPPLCEQKQIAKVLGEWDRSIRQTEQLIEAKQKLKKGLMQQLLTGKRRFPEFGTARQRTQWHFYDYPSEWAHPQLKEIASEVTVRNVSGAVQTVLSCSKYVGFVNSLEYFGKQVYSDDISNYKIVQRGQFAYPANHIEEGSIGLLDHVDSGIVSPIYVVFRTDPHKVFASYLYALFKTETYRHIFAMATNASVDRRGSLRWKEFSSIRVPLPSLDEQRRIAAVLGVADREIKILFRQLGEYRHQKRGLMQKLLTGQIRVKTTEEITAS